MLKRTALRARLPFKESSGANLGFAPEKSYVHQMGKATAPGTPFRPAAKTDAM